MEANRILQAWKLAQQSHDFYSTLERELGLTPTQVSLYFKDWNKLPHEEAVRIAEEHGMDVKTGGFAAYLVDKVP